MRLQSGALAITSVLILAALTARWALQEPGTVSISPDALQEYAGPYAWEPGAGTFVYFQVWNEMTGTDALVAIDESGELRALWPTGPDHFFAGPGAGIGTEVESRIAFTRDAAGRIAGLSWQRGDGPPRTARRADIERREDVAFANGAVRLAGTLTAPAAGGPHPAVILVHGSGAQNRDAILPFARFLVRRGMAVLGYDKRGVSASSGDWTTASFDDLAADVVAAFEHLKTRPDIDASRIGLLGWSQAGWVMPLAALRAKDLAFLISISGAGVPAAETTIDHARNEMISAGMPPAAVGGILDLMKLQNVRADGQRLGRVRGRPHGAGVANGRLATRIVSRLIRSSPVADDAAALFLRSGSHAAAGACSDAGFLRRAGQQHPACQEQRRLGSRAEGGRAS